MSKEFFPQKPDIFPQIYAYEEYNPNYQGYLKIGYTTVDVEERIKQQYPVLRPGGKPYNIVFSESAMYNDGGNFTDKDIHRYLENHGFKNVGGEWYRCSVEDIKVAWQAVRLRTENEEKRTLSFLMRPEQEDAVEKTMAYFESVYKEGRSKTPKFLWNAKMRFGKTFATYQLSKRMKLRRVLVLTFKPAVEDAWETDLKNHIDFEGWQFVSRNGLSYENANQKKPIVCFGSFQDYLGVNKSTGGIKAKNEWVHTINWDLVVFDEYHFGAWRDNAKKLFESDDEEQIESEVNDNKNEQLDETWLPITTSYYLFLSGTPFRAISSGEFIEEQVYNWTYSDEQRAKENWKGINNPYESLPRMVMMTYKIPEAIRKVAMDGEFNEFDLNVFFSTTGKKKDAKFVYENEVQKWLDLIRGAYLDSEVDELKVKGQSFFPFKETSLLNILNHTVWFMPNVASCYAMANLLKQRQNNFYSSYKVNVAAGAEAGTGLAALKPVLDSMEEPLESKTITLTCGKLTTGVTVKPWTGIFMLRKLSTPETYFQSAFRVQSPWVIDVEDNKKEIVKKECYVFDFALDRALKQISDYSTKLDINETNPEKKVAEFINFLPVLAYQDGAMTEINAGQILDIAMSGTTATLLARRWESTLLVNVDNATLDRLLNNPQAMEVLSKIEGFRSLNQDITTIITKSESVKKAKKEADILTEKQKKEISEEEKEYKSKRKEIQEKLLKFATRVPVFMYLTDFREYSLEDVITKLEPTLFKKVTGLDVDDFNLLVSLGIFNKPLMNDAVYKFKRYEDASLEYTGINKHKGEKVGLFDTVLSNEEYKSFFTMQQQSILDNANNNPIEAFTILKNKIENQSNNQALNQTQKANNDYLNNNLADYQQMKNIESQLYQEEPQPAIIKKEIPQFDSSKVNISAIVYHKAFGKGIITSLEKDKIVIQFNDFEKPKKFIYPQSFENGFLTIL